MAADLDTRLATLYGQLANFKPTDTASWQLAQIFNALLAEVRKQTGDDPIVAAIQPAEQSTMGNSSTSDCGTLAAATLQLREALD